MWKVKVQLWWLFYAFTQDQGVYSWCFSFPKEITVTYILKYNLYPSKDKELTVT
jgi:hypothetical protein